MRSHLISVHRCIIKMASTSTEDLSSPRPVIGVCQLTCTADKRKNLETSSALIRRAKARGAQVISFFLKWGKGCVLVHWEQGVGVTQVISV